MGPEARARSQEPCTNREGVPRACEPDRGQRQEAPRGPPLLLLIRARNGGVHIPQGNEKTD